MLAVRRLATTVVLLLLAVVADAQQPDKTYRVAYLAAAPRSGNQALLAWFQQGLRELGYVEGQNVVLETRFADGKFERLPMLAHELVRLNPDVLFVSKALAGELGHDVRDSGDVPAGPGQVPHEPRAYGIGHRYEHYRDRRRRGLGRQAARRRWNS